MYDSGWHRGMLNQRFKIKIDIDNLVDYITDQILATIADDKEIDTVDLDEWYVESDNTLVIDGNYEAYFKSFYIPATRWEPSYYEEEKPSIGAGDPKWMLSRLPEEIKNNVNIRKVEEDEEKCERDYFGEDEL